MRTVRDRAGVTALCGLVGMLAMASPARAAEVSGQVYDATTGAPVRGVAISIYYDQTDAEPGILVPAALLPDGQQGQVTGADGRYRLDLLAGRKYRLVVVTDRTSVGFPSTLIPQRPGFASDPDHDGKVVSGDTPIDPGAGAADRSYYLRFDLASAADQFANNHIPVDPLAAAVILDKRADRPTASLGDVVNYTLTVVNRSNRDLIGAEHRAIYLLDAPERGLSYLFGTAAARVDGASAKVGEHAETTRLRLIRLGPFDLPAGATLVVRYQVAVGVDTRPGQYRNRASVVDAGGVELSEPAVASLRIVPDATLETGSVVGRVFCDEDRDGRHDPGERGAMGARIYLDTGSYSVADSAGFYHLSQVGGGTHLVKLDPATLAGGSPLGEATRLLRLTDGLSARADFPIACARVAVDGHHPRAALLPAGAAVESEPTVGPSPAPGTATALALTGNRDRLELAVDGDRQEIPRATLALTGGDRWRLGGTGPGANLATAPAAGYVIEAPRWRTGWQPGVTGAAGRWQIAISPVAAAATPVRILTGTGAPPAEVEWDGRDDAGVPLASETLYYAQLTVSAARGAAKSARVGFAVDFGRPGGTERRVLRGNFFAGVAGKPQPTQELSEAVTALAAEVGAEATLVIESHFDGTGDRLPTIARTQREATLVADLLAAAGLAPDKVSARGRGSLEPLEAPGSPAGRAANRRLVVVITRPASAHAGAPIPAVHRSPGEVTLDRQPIEVAGDGAFATAVAASRLPVVFEMVTADGRAATVVLKGSSPGAGSGSGSGSGSDSGSGSVAMVSGDLAAGTIRVDGRALPAGLLTVDVSLPDRQVTTVADPLQPRLSAPLTFELHGPDGLEVSRWRLVVRDPSGAELLDVAAGGAGWSGRYTWDGTKDGALALQSGQTYRYQLSVVTAQGEGFSPERAFVVDGVGRPAGWTDIIITGSLFSGRGELRAGLKNQISRFTQQIAGRDSAEHYRLSVRAAITTPSATEERLARAARKTALRHYLIRLGLAEDRFQIEVVADRSDQVIISAEVPATAAAATPASPQVRVGNQEITLAGARFQAEVARGDHPQSLAITGSSGQRARFVGAIAAAPTAPTADRPAPAPPTPTPTPTTGQSVAAAVVRVDLPAEGQELAARELAVTGETAPGNRVFLGVGAPVEVAVADDGQFAGMVTLPVGDSELLVQTLDPAGNRAVIRWPVKVKDTQLLVLALGEATLSAAYTSRGWLADYAYLDGMNEDSVLSLGPALLHLRAAAYIKARFPAGALGNLDVTAHIDTAKQRDSGAFFAELVDPDAGPARDQPVYGDSATEVHDANSRSKLYLRVRGDGLAATIGSVVADLGDRDLFRYQRTVSGAVVEVDRRISDHRVEVTSFASGGSRELGRDVNWYRATGGSLYYLRHGRVVEGSERVRVVTRDRDTGLEIGSRTMARNRDYRVDYDGGRIMLVEPLASTAQTGWVIDNFDSATAPGGGHPVYLEVNYEHQDPGAHGDRLGGVRVRDQVGRVSVGAGVVGESRDSGDDYALWGADIAVTLGAGSRVSAELAGSRADDGDDYLSQDGGLSFYQLSGQALATAAGDRGHQLGWKLAGEVDLGDFVQPPPGSPGGGVRGALGRTRVAVSLQKVDRGFSAAGSALEQGRLKLGALVVHSLGTAGELRFRHIAEVAELPRVGPTAADIAANPDPFALDERATYQSTLQWARSGQRWRHQLEVSYQRLTSTAVLHDGGAAVDGRRLGFGATTGYRLSDRLTLRGGQQLVVGLSDADPWLDPIFRTDSAQRREDGLAGVTSNLGADLALTGDVTLVADGWQRWNGDNAAQVGLRSALGRGSMYLHERFAQVAGGGISTTIVGAEDRFGARGEGRTYGEYQLENGVLGARNRAVLGLGRRFRLAPGLRVAAGFEHQQVFGGFLPDGTPIGNGNRNILSGGAEYTPDPRFKASAQLELRFDRGLAGGVADLIGRDPRPVAASDAYADHGGVAAGAPLTLDAGDALQILSGLGVSWRFADAVTGLARMRLSFTGTRPDADTDYVAAARYSEVTGGLAYRPIDHDWLNLLVRYSYLAELRPPVTGEAQGMGEPQRDQRSHVFAAVPLAELGGGWIAAGKVAVKRTWNRSVTDGLDATVTSALVLARVGYRFYGRWDASGEARWLVVDNPNSNTSVADPDASGYQTMAGSLWEIGYQLDRFVRFGIGYNLSHFSDDELGDLDRDSHGFFLRVTGQY